ncbi:DUF1259 domain-containing protein [Planococcus versutus]|uniref:Uncharacterized protein n=1 Tax=Planococcus versutus TaxID=1302659 RepID=A0A1B1RX41_9BACL|nr:DUF1259 domain-containing protein [Planococcus versutus]ANU25505.1 hypothetical protein I858_000230 [Planococcus versutus]
MIRTNEFTSTAEKVSNFLNGELERHEDFWRLEKKRAVKWQHNATSYINLSLDLYVSFSSLRDKEKAVNMAEVFLMPEEMPLFTKALIDHVIPFPTIYSQQLSKKRGMYCVRLTAQELPEEFAERLSAALDLLV